MAFIRRSIKSGFHPGDFTSLDDLCERTDDKLFKMHLSLMIRDVEVVKVEHASNRSGCSYVSFT